MKEAGTRDELRKWFNHDPARWEEFRRRYSNEIRKKRPVLDEICPVIRKHGTVTFPFSAHDEQHNNAVALREFPIGMEGKRPMR